VTTFVEAVAKFKKSAEGWLQDEDAPALAALEGAAAALDQNITPALLSSYGLTYRALLARKPKEVDEDRDELDDIIPGE